MDDMPAPETEQSFSATQSTSVSGAVGPSWQDIILDSFHNRQTHDSMPRQRHGHDATEMDTTFEGRNDEFPSCNRRAPVKSAAQIDGEDIARFNEHLNAVTDPFDDKHHGEMVTGLRELIHWHQEQIEVVRRDDLQQIQRQQRMIGRLQVLLESAYVEREGADA